MSTTQSTAETGITLAAKAAPPASVSLATLAGGAELRTPAPGMALPFDPAKTIALRDPATGEPTGQTVTYAEAYALLYSAYLSAAAERDAAQQPAEPTEPATGA